MPTCLVVDDSSMIRKIARRILEGLNFQVIEAEDGVDALVHCKRSMPEAVLLDWNMPVMDGYHFLSHLRRMPGGEQRFGDMPIIALSSHSSPESIERGRQAGFHDYVAKFDRPGLIAALKEQTAEQHRAAA